MAHANNLLGLIALGRGDLDDSAKELYRAVDMFRRAQEPIELGRTMVNLCETLARLDRAAEASELLEEAAAIFTKYNLQLERDRLYIALGFLHYSQNDLAQAEAAFRQAYSPSMRRAGPVYLRSQVEMNLGNVLLLQSKTDESRSYFLSAVAGFRLIGSQTMLANSLDGLAETSLAAGEKQEAIDLYEEALGIVQAIPEDAFANRMETRFRALLEELKSVAEEEE
jgi:tetratricopeptide (TPR) repeat protein